MYFPDFPSPLISMTHRFQQVFSATSCVCKDLMKMSSCWSSNICLFVWRDPEELLAYKFVFTFPAGSIMSYSSYLDDFRDVGEVAVHLLLRGMLLRDLFSTSYSILVLLSSSFFSICLVSVFGVHPYNSMDMTAAWKNAFYSIGQVLPPYDRLPIDCCPCLR